MSALGTGPLLAVSGGTLAVAWAVFAAGVSATAAVDLLLVSRARPDEEAEASARRTPTFVRQIIYWLAAGALFNAFVWSLFGGNSAVAWLYGYVLEYALSFDNLFVFQVVFKVYSTPAEQVDRALFWGISVAVLLRLLFFGVGTEILSLGLLSRILFGLALVYSGAKVFRGGDDDEDDPTQNPLVRCIARMLPVHGSYSPDASFFIRVAGNAELAASPLPSALGRQHDVELDSILECAAAGGRGSVQPQQGSPTRRARELGATAESGSGVGRRKVTLLFLVVVTLGIIDIIFAVDSVTAKISSIANFGAEVDLFLNLTSSAMAMFVLRSLYTLVDRLVQSFRFLKYGVGAVLMLIGVKLMLSGYVEVGMVTSCAVIVGVLMLSILLSVVIPKPVEEYGDLDHEVDVERRGSVGSAGINDPDAADCTDTPDVADIRGSSLDAGRQVHCDPESAEEADATTDAETVVEVPKFHGKSQEVELDPLDDTS